MTLVDSDFNSLKRSKYSYCGFETSKIMFSSLEEGIFESVSINRLEEFLEKLFLKKGMKGLHTPKLTSPYSVMHFFDILILTILNTCKC